MHPTIVWLLGPAYLLAVMYVWEEVVRLAWAAFCGGLGNQQPCSCKQSAQFWSGEVGRISQPSSCRKLLNNRDHDLVHQSLVLGACVHQLVQVFRTRCVFIQKQPGVSLTQGVVHESHSALKLWFGCLHHQPLSLAYIYVCTHSVTP